MDAKSPRRAEAPGPFRAAEAKSTFVGQVETAVGEPVFPAVAEREVSARSLDLPSHTPSPSGSGVEAPGGPLGLEARGSPETVANLAAQILKKLNGKTTRFDIELTPHGLGQVNVRVEISAHGQISAALTFDNPQAAQDLRARAADLQRTLEQAGFDLSGGLAFDVADGREQQQRNRQDHAEPNYAGRGKAFQAAVDTVEAADPGARRLSLRRGVRDGVDVRV
ncbi:flagellar hook-length control protein FliK [uncultured Phenylobacterium sp.]|uniref:flagellar hook-length control protein FliK n=1 Tax=uncultured Phenylobacterium sp. TaxID=349273 RepID=UPI0025E2B783|nr:flagellar hook-length control protein FliK [uncultured Phenylobacterium sp.]